MPNHDALIEQLRAWASTLEGAVDDPIVLLGTTRIRGVVLGLREVAADLEREDLEARRLVGGPYGEGVE